MTGSAPTAGAAALPAAIAETHISLLVFLGDRAYKLKKPVRFAFLDFSTRERREAACHREVELNRRLAPDVYLGVADVLGPDGTPIDHLVVMRRMPADRSLATLVARAVAGDPEAAADVDRAVQELARLLVAFHARAERSLAIDAVGTPAATLARWDDNLRELAPFVGSVFDPAMVERVGDLAGAFVDGRHDLFAARIAGGHLVDGHGDLQCADVFCLADGPRVLDCIEFDDRLRYGDVVDDLAFLVMDLERLGAPEVAARLVRRYEELSGERVPRPLLHHAVAYRALVRAKVAALRVAPPTEPGTPCGPDVAEARDLLRRCVAHLEAGRVRLVLVGGLPGTGKTTVARGLAERLDADLLRTDEVRKELAGLVATARTGAGWNEGIYAPDATERTYGELLWRAGRLLANGESVVLDASWSDAGHRDAARRLAAEAHAELRELRCEVDPDVAAARMVGRAERGDDASDATPAVAAAMAATEDPWPEAEAVPTYRPPLWVLDHLTAGGRLRGSSVGARGTVGVGGS